VRDSANSAASSTPPATASASATKVMRTVNHQLCASEPKSSASAAATRDGAGSR